MSNVRDDRNTELNSSKTAAPAPEQPPEGFWTKYWKCYAKEWKRRIHISQWTLSDWVSNIASLLFLAFILKSTISILINLHRMDSLPW
ncbi:MAG: hypothetical protein M2R45_02708 [Verrucomicrobia subdivision 3 bacterium]|nr:hypothetical protein [Limisphaerales bacterium]MCS1415049.1 hypothetical protein [Limisphaerales bacterium]